MVEQGPKIIEDPFTNGLQNGLRDIVGFYQRMSKLAPEVAKTEKSRFTRGVALHLAKALGGLPIGEKGEVEGLTRTQQAVLSTWTGSVGMIMAGVDMGVQSSKTYFDLQRIHNQEMERIRGGIDKT